MLHCGAADHRQARRDAAHFVLVSLQQYGAHSQIQGVLDRERKRADRQNLDLQTWTHIGTMNQVEFGASAPPPSLPPR